MHATSGRLRARSVLACGAAGRRAARWPAAAYLAGAASAGAVRLRSGRKVSTDTEVRVGVTAEPRSRREGRWRGGAGALSRKRAPCPAPRPWAGLRPAAAPVRSAEPARHKVDTVRTFENIARRRYEFVPFSL